MTKRKKPEDIKRAGRKPFYDDETGPEEMAKAIEEYKQHCEKGKLTTWIDKKGQKQEAVMPIPPTVEDMALWLGFNGRQGLSAYEAKPKFIDSLTRARTWITAWHIREAISFRAEPKMAQLIARSIDPDHYSQKDDFRITLETDFKVLSPEEEEFYQRMAAERAAIRLRQTLLNHTSSTDRKQDAT